MACRMPFHLRVSSDEDDAVTLRITLEEESGSRAQFRLEGRLVAEWAALLERECVDVLRSQRRVRLDVADVNFVDRAGLEVITRLSRAGVEICCRAGPVASVLEGEGVPVTREADGVDEGWP